MAPKFRPLLVGEHGVLITTRRGSSCRRAPRWRLGLNEIAATKPGAVQNAIPPCVRVLFMKDYLGNRLIQIGLVLVLVGWTPLWGIVLLAAVGLWPDPNPNPIGPGLLFFFTSWPAIICLGMGVLQVRRN